MRKTMKLNLDEDVAKKLENLANEDEVSVDDFVEKFIELTDTRRHVTVNIILYGPGEKRFKCPRSNCKEKDEKSYSKYGYEE